MENREVNLQVWFQGKVWVGDTIVGVFRILLIMKTLGLNGSIRRANVHLFKIELSI